MKFYTTCIALAALASSSMVSSRPVFSRADKVMNGNVNFQQVAGAAYFMTNEPDGNFVVTADIGTDGKLTLNRAVSTGGQGQHGDDGAAGPGPDGLFSQGSVKASANGKILAAVNPGSSTLTAFKINPNSPGEIAKLGEPISTEGEFPVSLAINKNGDRICVLNGGQVNGVHCYTVDQNKGLSAQTNSLRSLDLNQTTPANGPAGTVSHVVFTEDEKQLVASVKGVPPNPGFLAVWDMDSNGSLSNNFTKVSPGKGGLLPFSMSVIPGKNALLATDAGVGFDIFDLSDVSQASNSNKTSVVPINGQMATCWSSFSKQTGNFYLTDIGTAMVTEVNVDQNLKGSIVKQYPQTNGSATIDNDIASVGGKDFMYVLQPNTTSVSVLALNAPGKAQNIQTMDFSQQASQVGLKISKANLQGMTTFIKN
ncbi:hypothetical protein EVG20_g4513 [Dentipellis fragilis]|uniref:3-carboxymuconate cyclase n=1 Tax=Dentipellis fragilis TaxID=205917 RepID=A0A4Y9YZM9_9AGAM|nr:hypothetical protein EVG20_g4513 [Dentipellis fragilis]